MLDYYQTGYKAFMVLERAGELTLEKLYKATEGKMPLAHVQIITHQLLTALSFLHAN